MVSDQGENHHDRNEQEFCREWAEYDGRRFAARFTVFINVHQLSEEMALHGKDGAENHHRFIQLGNVAEPTAEHKDQQVPDLIEEVERWQTLEPEGVVAGVDEKQRREPNGHLETGNPDKGEDERDLYHDDDPGQLPLERLVGRGSKKPAVFPRVALVAEGITEIVPPIGKDSQWEADIDRAQPKGGRPEHVTTCKGQQVEPQVCRPESRSGCLRRGDNDSEETCHVGS